MDAIIPPPVGTYIEPRPERFAQLQEDASTKKMNLIRLINHRSRKFHVDAQRFFILLANPEFQKILERIIKKSGIEGITYQHEYVASTYNLIRSIKLGRLSRGELIERYFRHSYPFYEFLPQEEPNYRTEINAGHFGLTDNEFRKNLEIYTKWSLAHTQDVRDKLCKYILQQFKLVDMKYPYYWLETCINYVLKGYIFPISTSVRIDTYLPTKNGNGFSLRREYTVVAYLREPVDELDYNDALLLDRYKNPNVKISSNSGKAVWRGYYDKVEKYFIPNGKGDFDTHKGQVDKGWPFDNFNEQIKIYAMYKAYGEDINKLIEQIDVTQIHLPESAKKSKGKTKAYIQEHIIDKLDSVCLKHLFLK